MDSYTIDQIVWGGSMSGTVVGIVDSAVNPGVQEAVNSGSGYVDPTHVFSSRVVPIVTFTTLEVGALLTAVGSLIGKDCTADLYFSKTADDGTKSGGKKVAIAQGMCVLVRIDASPIARATATIYCTYDGTHNPIVVSTASPPSGLVGATSVWVLGACAHTSAVLGQLLRATLDFGNSPQADVLGGDVYARHSWISRHAPVLDVSSADLATWLDVCGYDPAAIATSFIFYLAKATADGKLDASNALIFTATAGAIVLQGLQNNENGVAEVSYRVYFRSSNGVLAPLAPTTGSMAAVPTTHNTYTLGPCYANTSELGNEQWSAEIGAQVDVRFGSGNIYPTHISVLGRAPKFTVDSPDLAYFQTLNGEAAAISGTGFRLFARKTKLGNTVEAAASAVHVKITASAGIVIPRSAGGSHGAVARHGFDVIARKKDADTAGLLVDTAAAIA